jgi:hypothetical protein
VHEQRSTEFGTHFYRETKQNSAAAASKMPQKKKTSAAASLEVCACDAARGVLDTFVTQCQPRTETVPVLHGDFLLF